MVTRAQWGAQSFNCAEPIPAIDAMVVHYSASGADEAADHANCAARVRGIQSFHMRPKSQGGRGWCDIAYNFLFCKHGEVFEGRGWSRKSGATGAANSHTIAICFLGDDTANRDDVTRAGREALAGWLRSAERHFPGAQAAKGHRDYMATSCPGNELYNWVRTGAWRTLGMPKVRYELWARIKDKDGVLKPALIMKSAEVPPEQAQKRAVMFITRATPRYANLLALGRRPNIRKVIV